MSPTRCRFAVHAITSAPKLKFRKPSMNRKPSTISSSAPEQRAPEAAGRQFHADHADAHRPLARRPAPSPEGVAEDEERRDRPQRPAEEQRRQVSHPARVRLVLDPRQNPEQAEHARRPAGRRPAPHPGAAPAPAASATRTATSLPGPGNVCRAPAETCLSPRPERRGKSVRPVSLHETGKDTPAPPRARRRPPRAASPASARTRSAGVMSPYRRAETTFSPSSRTTFTVH